MLKIHMHPKCGRKYRKITSAFALELDGNCSTDPDCGLRLDFRARCELSVPRRALDDGPFIFAKDSRCPVAGNVGE
jgi:hypothetical protein